MSTAVRVPLAEASAVARGLVAVLALGCDRIEVAGSIRRGRPDVGDVEIVAVPRVETVTVERLFDEVAVERDELDLLVDTLLAQGTIAPHPTDPKRGPRYAKLVHAASGLQVDVFKARPDTFGLIWLIRTGPAEYSRALVTGARERGHHVAGGELHVGRLGCGAIACDVVPTPEEADVYRALGLPWVGPEARR